MQQATDDSFRWFLSTSFSIYARKRHDNSVHVMVFAGGTEPFEISPAPRVINADLSITPSPATSRPPNASECADQTAISLTQLAPDICSNPKCGKRFTSSGIRGRDLAANLCMLCARADSRISSKPVEPIVPSQYTCQLCDCSGLSSLVMIQNCNHAACERCASKSLRVGRWCTLCRSPLEKISGHIMIREFNVHISRALSEVAGESDSIKRLQILRSHLFNRVGSLVIDDAGSITDAISRGCNEFDLLKILSTDSELQSALQRTRYPASPLSVQSNPSDHSDEPEASAI